MTTRISWMMLALILAVLAPGRVDAQVHVDLSGASFEVHTPESFTIRRLTAQGFPGVYWAAIHWTGAALQVLEAGVDIPSPCSAVRCLAGSHCVAVGAVAICALDPVESCTVTCPAVGGLTATLNGTCADYASQIKNHGCACSND